MTTTRSFGTTRAGEPVTAYTVSDGEGSVTLLDYGALVQSLFVPGADGRLHDVVLGHNDLAGYEDHRGHLGATVGRFANRIRDARIVLDGRTYELVKNDGAHHRHGGSDNFSKRVWKADLGEDFVEFSLLSPDGDQGYPGNLRVSVRYTFGHGTLGIAYRATTDRPTVLNLTNHTYFNLGGEASGSVLGQLLRIDSEKIVWTDASLLPVGGFRSVFGTPFDFTSPKPIGRDIGADDGDLLNAGGYDHCYLLGGTFSVCAEAFCPGTGIAMTCRTDMPAVQFYSANGLRQFGKGTEYAPRDGFCLETQFIPDNPNMPEYAAYGSSVLRPGETFARRTEYAFSVRK